MEVIEPAFEYTNEKLGLTVYEGATAFWIVYKGETRCMGDGVDRYSVAEVDGSLRSVDVGTPEFYDLMRAELDSDFDAHELIRAYFGEEAADEP